MRVVIGEDNALLCDGLTSLLEANELEVVSALLARRGSDTPLQRLTERELEVLALMAEGRSNTAIAGSLFVTDKAIGKHISNIFAKLDLPPHDDDNRRVPAVVAYLQRQDGQE